MKFTDALSTVQRRPADAAKFPVALACGIAFDLGTRRSAARSLVALHLHSGADWTA